ncbi:hypothetical protein IRZ70_02100 [Pseudomonas monteilii]|nr:hypothetical protein [Pseudomonas monteilii]
MWSLSPEGRKHFIGFINNMMALAVLLGVCLFVVVRMEGKGWVYYAVSAGLFAVSGWAVLCNFLELMEAYSKSDVRLVRVKRFIDAKYEGGGFKASLLFIKYNIKNRRLRIVESSVLPILLCLVTFAMFVAAVNAIPKRDSQGTQHCPVETPLLKRDAKVCNCP